MREPDLNCFFEMIDGNIASASPPYQDQSIRGRATVSRPNRSIDYGGCIRAKIRHKLCDLLELNVGEILLRDYYTLSLTRLRFETVSLEILTSLSHDPHSLHVDSNLLYDVGYIRLHASGRYGVAPDSLRSVEDGRILRQTLQRFSQMLLS